MEKIYVIAVRKLVKNSKGKYNRVLAHESFKGTWEELEQYIEENNLILEGWDHLED